MCMCMCMHVCACAHVCALCMCSVCTRMRVCICVHVCACTRVCRVLGLFPRPQLHPFELPSAGRPWAGHLTPLRLSLFLCTGRVAVVPMSSRDGGTGWSLAADLASTWEN